MPHQEPAVLSPPEIAVGLRDRVQRLPDRQPRERFLRRPADAIGLATFSDALLRGTPEDAVILALTSSDEYVTRLS